MKLYLETSVGWRRQINTKGSSDRPLHVKNLDHQSSLHSGELLTGLQRLSVIKTVTLCVSGHTRPVLLVLVEAIDLLQR